MMLEERFWSKVEPEPNSGCWLWNAGRIPDGYGTFYRDGRSELAHRVSWVLEHGGISPGDHVLHRCDNPSCVNPEHLFVGTHTDNMRDASRKGRCRTSSRAGEKNPAAKLTRDDVRAIRESAATSPVLAKRYGVSASTIRRVRCYGWIDG